MQGLGLDLTLNNLKIFYLENEPIAHSSKCFDSSSEDTSLQTAIAWRWSNQSLTIWAPKKLVEQTHLDIGKDPLAIIIA